MRINPIKIMSSAIGAVFSTPMYLFIAIGAWFLVLGILVWAFSFGALLYVFGLSGISTADKLFFFLSPYSNSLTYFFGDPVVASRMIFTILTGIVITMHIYIKKQGKTYSKRKDVGGLAIALTSSGCIACGTSLLSPFLTTVGAGVGYVIGITISTVGYIVSIVLMLFALHGVSKRVLYESVVINQRRPL